MAHGENYLQVGQYLKVGEYLASNNKLFFAIMQVNGVLGIYRGTPENNQGGVWSSSNEQPHADYFAIMQVNGVLGIYRGTPENNQGGVWSSSKKLHNANYITYLHNNGNLCIYENRDPSDIEYDNKGVVWCTNAVDPIDKITVEEVYYHLENAKKSNPILKEIGSAVVKNTTSTHKESSFSLTKTLEESSSWSGTVSVNVTATESMNIGIPEIGDAGLEISIEVGVSFTYGQTTTRSKSLSHDVMLSADPYTEVTCLSVIKDSVITVPCTFKGKATLKSKTILPIEFDGTYMGTTAYDIEDTYSEHTLDGSQHKISFTEYKSEL